MDENIVLKVKAAINTTHSAVIGKAERVRAIYDMAVHKFGVERVGEFDEYMNKPHGYWTFEKVKSDASQFKKRRDWQLASA